MIRAKSNPVLLLVVMLVLASLSGCAPRLMRIEPLFEDSNQVFLEQTVDSLGIVNSVGTVIPPGSKVCIVSMERSTTGDYPLIAMIEDKVVRLLKKARYVVLERDDDLLRRLISERGETYRLVWLPTDLPKEFVFDTLLVPAEYLVCYRVLECGIIYRKGSEEDLMRREGMLRVHVRVQDTQSGEIVLADNLTAMVKDEVDRRIAEDLSDFHYSFFPADTPLVQGASTGMRVMGRSVIQDEKPARGKKPGDAKVLLGVIVAAIVGLVVAAQ